MENNHTISAEKMTLPDTYTGVTPLPDTVVTAMAYIPFQTDTTQYTPETALSEGTLFPNLNKPFLGGKCK